jgi:hypothetical protein
MKVVDIFNTFLESIYSLILVGYFGRYEFVKIAVSFVVRIIGSVQNLFKVVLRNLGSRI